MMRQGMLPYEPDQPCRPVKPSRKPRVYLAPRFRVRQEACTRTRPSAPSGTGSTRGKGGRKTERGAEVRGCGRCGGASARCVVRECESGCEVRTCLRAADLLSHRAP